MVIKSEDIVKAGAIFSGKNSVVFCVYARQILVQHFPPTTSRRKAVMNRREFVRAAATFASSTVLPQLGGFMSNSSVPDEITIGHGSHRYQVDLQWGQLDPAKVPVNDCHEMVQDQKGRLILLTNETKNNVIIYDRSGKALTTWGQEYPGAHGLTLWNANGEEFLFISDNNRHEVIKTTLDGRVLMTIGYPRESGKYEKPEQYIPTEVAIAPNGDIYVADGYGEQHIMQYNEKGEYLRCFGGRGEGEANFKNAHGICLDTRDKKNPTLLITERVDNKLKRFSLAGEYLGAIALPGAFICRPVIDDENVYCAALISRTPWDSQTGYVTILDKHNRVISNPGGSAPVYENGVLQQMQQTVKVFKHPHDVCVDNDKNIYVAQWNSGKVYPIKLARV